MTYYIFKLFEWGKIFSPYSIQNPVNTAVDEMYTQTYRYKDKTRVEIVMRGAVSAKYEWFNI